MSVKNRESKQRRHARVCAAKVKHPDRETAFTALMSLVRNRGAVARQMQPYRCLACYGWHVGHRM